MTTTAIDLAKEKDFQLGAAVVRPSTREIALGSDIEVLEPRVMQVLVALAQNSDAVVSKDDLLERCWHGRLVGEDALHRCISKLRRLPESHRTFAIDAVPRVGFRLRVLGSESDDASPKPSDRWWWDRRTVAWLVIVAGLGLFSACAGFVWIETKSGETRTTGADQIVYRGFKTFSDCADGCPEMVALPPGTVKAGTTNPEDPWGKVRTVVFNHGFAIGKYDITRAEYARFTKDGGYPVSHTCFSITRDGDMLEGHGRWQAPGFPQTPSDPAVCISWDDANAYVAWLSRRTGVAYRLPTETEWLYAAGPEAAFADPAGSPLCNRVNGADRAYHAQVPGDPAVDQRCSDGYAFTSPVGKFSPNFYGLYDIMGNVVQWMQDCFAEQPLSTPLNGEASLMNPCSRRVVRGGSWSDDLKKMRLTRRGSGSPADHYPQNGFRVARDL